VYHRARGFLGDVDDLPTEPADDLRLLDAQLAVVTGLVRDLLAEPVASTPDRVVKLSELLSDVQTLRFSVYEHLGFQRLHRLEGLERGLESLWRIQDQDELLRLVCSTAVESCGFDRVMLSRVDEGVWRPWRSVARHLGDAEQRLDEWMRGRPKIPLNHGVLEGDLVRRRESGIVRDVVDAGVYEPLRDACGMTSYVVAPLLADDRVVGLLHADHQGASVTELDRDVLAAFARGLGRVLERADLVTRLREQRDQVLEGMRLVERNLDALVTAETALGQRPAVESLGDLTGGTRQVRPAAIESVLTSRELEVLALMATGATNDRIAQRLVIATETVKTHVKRVLRKLGAENRAEAISMYLRLSVGGPEEPRPPNVRALPL
jgi:DNA-binding CsgD family transcriptional regulator